VMHEGRIAASGGYELAVELEMRMVARDKGPLG
jgi:hypothetical protein